MKPGKKASFTTYVSIFLSIWAQHTEVLCFVTKGSLVSTHCSI